jgi:hypothetical protein
MNDKNKISKDLYNAIYDKLKEEPQKTLLIIKYEIEKCINDKMVVDFENLSIELEPDFKDALFVYGGITYTKSVVYQMILKIIKNLTKGNSNE